MTKQRKLAIPLAAKPKRWSQIYRFNMDNCGITIFQRATKKDFIFQARIKWQ